ncbi:hypothetical protein NKDENANG_01817 [Candidatus Entotheonellaceae bacterium PAL068K]
MSLVASMRGTARLGSWTVVALGLAWVWGLTASMGHAEAAAMAVNVTTTPLPHAIRPDADYARVTLHVLWHGQPLPAGHLQVDVASPPRASILSTDFPMVEGTPLLSLASDVRDGVLTFDYVFPVRGTYAFDLTVSPVPGGVAFPITTVRKTIHVRENPAEVRNGWFLVIGLFLLGGLSGVLFGRSAAARDALQSAAILALAVGLGNAVPAVGNADEAAPGQYVAPGDAGWLLTVRPTPPRATVGHLVQFDIVLSKDGTVFPDATQMTLLIHHVEDDNAVFHTTTRARHGRAAQSFQFFDGAPHTVSVTAQPADSKAGAALRVAFAMHVEGRQPPMAVKLRTLVLLLGVLGVGMVAGFCLSGRREAWGGA